MEEINLDILEQIIIEAGDFALEKCGNIENIEKEVSKNIDADKSYFEEKKAFSYIDTQVQYMIMQKVLKNYPKTFGIIAEEENEKILKLYNKFLFKNKFKENRYTLLIDPIDGSKNYLSKFKNESKKFKENFWGVSILITLGTQPIIGLIYYPAIDDGVLLKVKKGKGLFINNKKIRINNNILFSSKNHTRVSSAAPSNIREFKNRFPDDIYNPGSFVTTLLAIIKGTCEEAGILSDIDSLVDYKAYIGKHIDVLDLGCSSLAYSEAGGTVCNLKGEIINPIDYWAFNSNKKSIVIDKLFFFTSSINYFLKMKKHLNIE